MDPIGTSKRLKKSKSQKMLAGVCGGVAEYFAIDVTIVRILWVLATLFGGWGLLVYIAAVILMPSAPAIADAGPAPSAGLAPRVDHSRFWGILLIVVGIFWLSANLGFRVWFPWWGLSWKSGVGILLILGGATLLFERRSGSAARDGSGAALDESSRRPSPEEAGTRTTDHPRRLMRSSSENILFGVCGGIASYTNLDPVIIRLLFVVAALGSVGMLVVAYLVLAIVLPLDRDTRRTAVAS